MKQLLNISTVPARLSINAPLGQYDITSPKASLNIDIKKSEPTVQKDPIKVNIDRREMYDSMGIYMPENFRRKTVNESKQVVLDTIAQIGDDWRSIGETQGRTLVDICLRNSGWTTVELQQAWIPSVKPDMTWTGGTPTRVDFSPYQISFNWTTNPRPNVEYYRGQTDISISQWHQINIEYVGNISDTQKVGMESARKLNIKV